MAIQHGAFTNYIYVKTPEHLILHLIYNIAVNHVKKMPAGHESS